MAENRRRISSSRMGDVFADRGYDSVNRTMEDQLRLQARIVATERDRQAALENTRLRQEVILRDAEKGLNALRSEAADSSWSTAIARTTSEMAQAGKAFTEMRSRSDDFVKSTGSGLKSLFRALFRGEIDSATEVWNYFCNFLSDAFSNALSKMASKGIEQLFENLIGLGTGGGSSTGILSGLFHSGGVAGSAEQHRMVSPFAFLGAPRLHSGLLSTSGTAGLAPDEFPAILQKGEMVIPRGKWAYAGGGAQSLQVEVKIDNQSSVPLKLDSGPVSRSLDKIVVGIVARDIEEYGVLGKILNQRRG